MRTSEYKIYGMPPVSSKNNKLVVRGRLMNNPKVLAYKKWAMNEIDQIKDQLIEEMKHIVKDPDEPYHLHMRFKVKDRIRRDAVNFFQLPQDMLVESGIIEDDNWFILIPVFEGVEIDKEEQGFSFWLD